MGSGYGVVDAHSGSDICNGYTSFLSIGKGG